MSFHTNDLPGSPSDTKRISCVRSREAILTTCAYSFDEWDRTAEYIIKETDTDTGIYVNVEDFSSLVFKHHLHIYLKGKDVVIFPVGSLQCMG